MNAIHEVFELIRLRLTFFYELLALDQLDFILEEYLMPLNLLHKILASILL